MKSPITAEVSNRRFLFLSVKRKETIRNLFFTAFFINLTIPKAGIYFRKEGYIRFPVTLGYIIFLVLFLIWVIFNRKNLRAIFLGSFIKKLAVFYLIYALLRYLFIDFNNYKYLGKIFIHYTMYGGYLLAFYFALDMAGYRLIPVLTKIIGISMCIVSLYGLMQVFFDSEQIALVGLTETYGSLKEPIISRADGGYTILEGSASMKNSIFSNDNFVGRKVFSTFLHGNVFGGHLVLFAPVIFAWLGMVRQRKQKVMYFCLAFIVIQSLLFANSRGALVGFFGSSLTLFLITREKKKAFLLLASVLLSGLMLFSLILNLAERYDFKITSAEARSYRRVLVRERYGIIFELPRLSKQRPVTLGNHVEIEQNSLDFTLNRLTNYRYREFKKFCREFFGKENIKYLIFGRGYTGMDVYQNLYFNLLYHLGILGFSLFLYIIIYILWMSIKAGVIFDQSNSAETRSLVMAGISGIVGFLIYNLFDNLLYFPPMGLNFWILGGIVLMAANYKEKS